MIDMDCPLCKKKISRLDEEIEGRCDICTKIGMINCRCADGHQFCKECTENLIRARVKQICKASTAKNPYCVLEESFKDDIIASRFLKNHILVGSALATAYNNCLKEKIDLEPVLDEIMRRGALIPPKACGHAGDCGAAVSAGIFYSVITDTHPLTPGEQWGEVAILTGTCLVDLGKIGGPRCCNRGTMVAMRNSVQQVKEKLGVEMEWKDIKCRHKDWNKNCKGETCPYF